MERFLNLFKEPETPGVRDLALERFKTARSEFQTRTLSSVSRSSVVEAWAWYAEAERMHAIADGRGNYPGKREVERVLASILYGEEVSSKDAFAGHYWFSIRTYDRPFGHKFIGKMFEGLSEAEHECASVFCRKMDTYGWKAGDINQGELAISPLGILSSKEAHPLNVYVAYRLASANKMLSTDDLLSRWPTRSASSQLLGILTQFTKEGVVARYELPYKQQYWDVSPESRGVASLVREEILKKWGVEWKKLGARV